MARKKKEPFNWVRALHGGLAILFLLVVIKACNRGMEELEEPSCYFDSPLGIILQKEGFRRTILRKNIKAFQVSKTELKIEFIDGDTEYHKIGQKCKSAEIFDR